MNAHDLIEPVAVAMATVGVLPPQPLEFSYMGGQVNGPVEQQSPNFFRCKHEPPLEPCDSKTWVVNPLGSVPCAWDVDDHFSYAGYGYVESDSRAGARVVGVSTVAGLLADPDGLDVDELLALRDSHGTTGAPREVLDELFP